MISFLIRLFIKATPAKQKQTQQKLFTPGPLNTTERVKQSMNFDYGSRDPNFIAIIEKVRNDLLQICKLKKGKYECILMQGSGTFGIEAVIGTAIPKTKHQLLICINGAYGDRMTKIANILNINFIPLKYQDNETVNPQDVQEMLNKNSDITHVAIVHSETTSGSLNPINDIGKLIKAHNKNIVFIVDSMSSFGAYEIYPDEVGIDYLVSSPNKNLQGIPGFSFVIANTQFFSQTQNNARSLVLDLYDQWKTMNTSGQFRYTPPTHVLRASSESMDEFNEEGGILARQKRYQSNQQLLTQRMSQMGFKTYLEKQKQGCIITTFLQPNHKNFNFNGIYQQNLNFSDFYLFLAQNNYLIYPGKLTVGETFRIGSIGDIHEQDIINLTDSIQQYLKLKQLPIPLDC